VAKASRTEAWLQELIALPSVNPAFLPKGDERTGEGAVAQWVAERAREAGMEVAVAEVAPGRPIVIAKLAPKARAKRRVCLAPHLDTVGEPNLDAQLKPRTAAGRIYGRGACDTKGCVASMLAAITAVATSGRRPESTELVFLGLPDEENGQRGSHWYARDYAPIAKRGDLAVVGEPTRLRVVSAHKGDVWLRLRTQGRAAHGATPKLGRNAVHEMARVVDALETEYASQLATRSHPLLGTPTVNVGSIRGGSQPNIVPESCEISVDRRTLPGETERGVRREITRLLRGKGLKTTFANLRLSACDPLETDPAHPLVQALLRAAGADTTEGVHYFCDAAPLAQGGLPAVVFGPGDIAQAHTRDEWISTASLNRGAAIYERFLRELE
jgi:succinyl-diaminopimelate desuccinylase